jgi:tyrosyl-tRNA synthetase
MAFDDSQIVSGFEILTSYDVEQVKEIQNSLNNGENPINIKKRLAF